MTRRGADEPRLREGPVARWRAAAAVVALLAAALAVLAGVDLLRPGAAGDQPGVGAAAVDPRVAVECPGAQPREGLARDIPAAFARLPAVTVSSADLLDCPEHYDGRRVVYRGEVVGQVIGRGTRAWIQVNDDAYAGALGPLPAHRSYLGGNSGLGVHAARESLTAVRWHGGPGVQGDRIEVHGTFHRTARETGEIAVVTAERLVVLAEGGPLERTPRRDRQVVSVLLLGASAGLLVLQRRRARA